MIRSMEHNIGGVEIYRSTFNTVTGDIVRITEEPSCKRQGYSHSSDEWDRITDFIEKKLVDNGMEWKDSHKFLQKHFEGFVFRKLAWSPSPETIDIKIIGKCGFGCKYCYMDSKKNDTDIMSVESLVSILKAFNPLPYQVAYGGGEPCEHPDFVNLLKTTREIGVVPNYTTAGHIWKDEIIDATNEYCGGIALTYHAHKGINWFNETYLKWRNNIRAEKRINVHLIADKNVVTNIKALTHLMLESVGKINLVLLAFYPDVGRASLTGLMPKTVYQDELPDAINAAIEAGMSVSYSEGLIPYFLSRPQIKVNTSLGIPQEGRFSCYIDTAGKMSNSSFSQENMTEVKDGNYQKAWHLLHTHYGPSGDSCYDCKYQNRCSTPNIHHYLICNFARHNGGTGNKVKSYWDIMREELADMEDSRTKEAFEGE
jgi:hypothetical protein